MDGSVKILGVEGKVLSNKRRNIPETVVVSSSRTVNMVVISLNQSLLQVFSQQLFLKLIVKSHIQEHRSSMRLTTSDQFSRIISFSLLLRLVEEKVEGFDSPCWTLSRIAHRSKSRY